MLVLAVRVAVWIRLPVSTTPIFSIKVDVPYIRAPSRRSLRFSEPSYFRMLSRLGVGRSVEPQLRRLAGPDGAIGSITALIALLLGICRSPDSKTPRAPSVPRLLLPRPLFPSSRRNS